MEFRFPDPLFVLPGIPAAVNYQERLLWQYVRAELDVRSTKKENLM